MELSYVTQLAVLALIVGTVTPVPVNLNLFKDDKTCAKRCFAIKTVHYEVGTIYSYSYSATAKTLIAGASKDSAFVKIDADVDIVSTSPCDFVMKLKNTKMSDSEKTARGQKSAERQRMVQFSDALEVHMLRFSSQGGRIEDVCPDMDEPAWVLNIKRGILSTLQSSMEGFKHNQTFVETDTNGDCPTSYTATTTSSAYKVTKTKDLSQCLRRQEYDSAIQSIGYSLESGIQSLPILKSRSVCHQSIDRREGHLLVSECSETNTFRPFSSGDNGASNVNSQTLRFTRKSSSGKPSVGYIDYRTDLTYHHHNDHQKQQQQQQQTSIKDVQAHLRTVCQQVQGDVRPETPSGVYKLVKLMRRVDTATLDSLYADIESGSLCPTKGKKNELREVFLDVLPMLGTGPAVDFMVTKVTSGAVSNARQILWQLSFPYIAKPTRQMLVSMKKLLDSDYHNDHTLLLVSSVVGHYCHDNPQCSEEEVVKGIVGIIESLIGDCRWDEMNRPNYDPRQRNSLPPTILLHAIKSLGNIGRSVTIATSLERCLSSPTSPVEVRLAAIDAFRRVPCGVSASHLEPVLFSESEDSEVRITAYLTLMKCPTEALLIRVADMLQRWPESVSQQVRSFILSHMRNLQTTADPHLKDLREVLANLEVLTKAIEGSDTHDDDNNDGDDEAKRKRKSEADYDLRKFSRHYEGSTYFDSVGAGARATSDVIFSSKSYVPRSANLNLTLSMFGHAVNFLEVGARVEGTERMLESFFGPKGDLSNGGDGGGGGGKSKDGTTTGSKFPIPDIDEKYQKETRGTTTGSRRGGPQRNQPSQGPEQPQNAQGSAYFRVFGHEVGYWRSPLPSPSSFSSSSSSSSSSSRSSWFREFLDVEALLRKMTRERSGSIDGSWGLADIELTCATGPGLPLRLSFTAVGSVKVDASAAVRTPSLKNMHVNIAFSPSAAIDVTGEMSVDAFMSRAGVRMSSVAHTNVAAEVSVSLKDRQVLSASLQLPKKKMEVVNVRSDIFLLHRVTEETNTPLLPSSKTVQRSHCTSPVFNTITGLQACMQLQYSNASDVAVAPHFPLTGSSVFKLELSAQDLPSGYKAEANIIQALKMGFYVDTPGSRTDRKISADVDIGQTAALIQVQSPWKTLKFKGKSEMKPNYELSGEFSVDHKTGKVDRYKAALTVDKTRAKQVVTWKPKFEISSPQKRWVAEGRVVKTQDKSVTGDFMALGFFNQNVTLEFRGNRVKKAYTTSAVLRVNEKKKYEMKSDFGAVAKGRGTIYSANLAAKVASRDVVKLTSRAIYNPGLKMSFDAGLDHVFSSKVQVSAMLLTNKKKMENTLRFSLKSPLLTTTGKGNVILRSALFAAHIDCSYKLSVPQRMQFKDKMVFKAKLKDDSTAKLTHYTGTLEFTSQVNPKRNLEIRVESKQKKGRVEAIVDVRVGKKNPDITFWYVTVDHDFTGDKKTLKYDMGLKNVKRGVDFKLECDHMHHHHTSFPPPKLTTNLNITYSPGKSLELNLKHDTTSRKTKVHETALDFAHLGKKVSVVSVITEKSRQEIDLDLSASWANGRKVLGLKSAFTINPDGVVDLKNALTFPDQKRLRFDLSGALTIKLFKLGGALKADRGVLSPEEISYELKAQVRVVPGNVEVNGLVGWSPDASTSANFVYTYSDKPNQSWKKASLSLTMPFKELKNLVYTYELHQLHGHSLISKYSVTGDYFKTSSVFRMQHNTLDIDYTERQEIKGIKESRHFKLVNNHNMFKFFVSYSSKFNILIQLDKASMKNFEYWVKYETKSVNFLSKMMVNPLGYPSEFFSNGSLIFSLGPDDIVDTMFEVTRKSNKFSAKANFDLLTPRKIRHRGRGDLSLTRARDGNILGKTSVHYNDRTIYSLVQSYKRKQDDILLKTELVLPNSEVLTAHTDIKLSKKKTFHSEISLKKVDKSVSNITLDSSLKFEAFKALDAKLQVTTNHQYFDNFFAHVVYKKKKDVDKLTSKVNIFGMKINTVTSIEGESLYKKSLSFKANRNGFDVISVSGNYDFDPSGDMQVRIKGSTKQISKLQQFVVKLEHLVSSKRLAKSREKNNLELEVSAKVDDEKYAFITKGKYFTSLVSTVTTPSSPRNGFSLVMTHDYKNAIDIDMKLIYDNVPYIMTFKKQPLTYDMKFTASFPPLKEFKVIFSGGMSYNKKGDFSLRTSYGKYYMETKLAVSFRNHLQVAFNSTFDAWSNTGAAGVEFRYYFDEGFAVYTSNFRYNKRVLNLDMSVKRNAVTFNLNVPRVAELDLKIDGMTAASTDISIMAYNPYMEKRSIKYFHKQKRSRNGAGMEAGLEVLNARNAAIFKVEGDFNLQPEYRADIVVTLRDRTRKYSMTSTLETRAPRRSGMFRLDFPKDVIPGGVFDINFKQEPKNYVASCTYDRMEYEIRVRVARDKTQTTIKCNWNKDNRLSNFVADIDHMSDGTNFKHDIKVKHPARTFGVTVEGTKTRAGLDVRTDIHWDVDNGRKFSFGFGNKGRMVYGKLYYPDRTLMLSTGYDDSKTTKPFTVEVLWDVDHSERKKMSLTFHVDKRERSFTTDVALNFLPSDKVFQWSNHLTWGQPDKVIWWRSVLNINNDPARSAELEAGLMREMAVRNEVGRSPGSRGPGLRRAGRRGRASDVVNSGTGTTTATVGYRLVLSLSRPKYQKHDVKFEAWVHTNGGSSSSSSPPGAGIELAYTTIRNEMRVFRLDVQEGATARELNFTMRTPLKNVWCAINARIDKDYELSVVRKDGDSNSVETYIVVSPHRNNFKLTIDYDKRDPTKRYVVDANLMTNKLLVVKAFPSSSSSSGSGQSGADNSDVDITLKLDNDLLKANMNWRPSMGQELKGFIIPLLQQSLGEAKMLAGRAETMVNKELSALLKSSLRFAALDWSEVKKYFAAELPLVWDDTFGIHSELQDMYQQNYLNVRYGVGVLHLEGSKILRLLHHHWLQGSSHVVFWFRATKRATGAAVNMAVHNLIKLYPTTVLLYTGKVTKQLMMTVQQWYEKWSDWHLDTLTHFDNTGLQDFLNDIRQHKYYHILVLAAQGEWRQLSHFLSANSKPGDFLSVLKQTLDFTRDLHSSANVALHQTLTYLSQRPLTQDFVALTRELYQQALWAWKYWGFDQSLGSVDVRLKQYLTQRSAELKRQVFYMDHMTVHMFDPHRGRISFDLSLTLPRLVVNVTRHTVRAVQTLHWMFGVVDRYVGHLVTSMCDLWDAVTSQPHHPTDLVPPFDARASIFQDMHYITFDGKYYQMSGECNYVLTRDFVDNNFTIIANYQPNKGRGRGSSSGSSGGKKTHIASILFYKGADKFEITKDYEVLQSDRAVDLPLRVPDLTVERIGSMVKVTSEAGAVLEYDPFQQYVTVDISGFYFGKVAGLLGTYDNELNNELNFGATSDLTKGHDERSDSRGRPGQPGKSGRRQHRQRRRRRSYEIDSGRRFPVDADYDDVYDDDDDDDDDMTVAARSWAMPGCRVLPSYPSREEEAEGGRGRWRDTEISVEFPEFRSDCYHWFSTSSPLSDCFDKVSPYPYHKMCLSGELTPNAYCPSVAFYAQQCSRMGVKLTAPQHCLSCADSTGSIPGEVPQFPAQKSADVVFVVEERECNQRADKVVSEVTRELTRTLSSMGVRNIQYGVVGFGGKNLPPHYSRTSKSRLLYPGDHLPQVLRSLSYDGFADSDPRGAIEFAATYPSSVGVRRSVVVVKCSVGLAEGATSDGGYYGGGGGGSVFDALKAQDISLHLLRDSAFRANTNRNIKTIVYGVDRSRAFSKDSRPATGDSDLFRELQMPQDFYARLSLATNGSVFDLRPLRKQPSLRPFLERFTHRVAESVTSPPCLACECHSTEGNTRTGVLPSTHLRCPSCTQAADSSYFTMIQPLFHPHLSVDEAIKEQFRMYWKRFKKTPTKGRS